jgi:hypothetical protein
MILAVKSKDEILSTNRSHQVHGEEITAIAFKRTDKHDRTRAREDDLIAATIERRDLHAAGAAIFPMRPCGIERVRPSTKRGKAEVCASCGFIKMESRSRC